jgi:O-antigen ligase
MKIIASVTSVMLVNIVFLMGARTSYVIFIALILTLILLYFINKDLRKFIINTLVIFIVGFIISTSILGTDNSAFVSNRASSIDFQEESTATRLRYYKYGLNEFFSNPLIGVGTGNWKIQSIGLDKENIRSYVVPYTMHNDLLEVAVELGLIGLILYSLIFYFTIINLWSLYHKNKSKEFILIIPLALLIYLIDSMINFPFTRASQLFYLAMLIALSQYFLKFTDEDIN